MTLEDIYYFLQGNLRYQLFYSKFAFLIRKHIREQIMYRIHSMDIECYDAGECKMCGCSTTALQMCNKPCDKPCYPSMISKKEWNFLKRLPSTYMFSDRKTSKAWIINNRKNKFINPDKYD